MKSSQETIWFVCFFIFHFLLQQGVCFNPLCYVIDCCSSKIIFKEQKLKTDLEHMLHGQHLVQLAIVNHITSHLLDEVPKKALVLSFHGETGTGKNYVAEIIINNLYYNGIKSDFVHTYHAAIHFPHESMSLSYIEKLKYEIKKAVYLCPRSTFIFDEFHLMPPNVIDILQVYLDFHKMVDGVDYRKAIFIFISNLASENIRNFTVSHYMKGIDRNEIKLRDFEFDIAHASFTEKGGFYASELIKSHLVTAYVPFLPLQRTHVKECIHDELKRRKQSFRYSEAFINKVLAELHFINGFSETGCKRIFEKVSFILIDGEL